MDPFQGRFSKRSRLLSSCETTFLLWSKLVHQNEVIYTSGGSVRCGIMSLAFALFFSLKEQLAKEQRDHAEAISDVERNAVQERERLKKEIERRVEETKKEMTRLMEEQLHQVSLSSCQNPIVDSPTEDTVEVI